MIYNLLLSLVMFLSFLNYAIAQTCSLSIIESTPTIRFLDNNDGTVTDKFTGLVWMRCSAGQEWSGNSCDGEAVKMTWGDALAHAEQTSFANKDDWYLPNIKELGSIIEESCHSPAVNEMVFLSAESSNYWSSSIPSYFRITNEDRVMGINFESGGDAPANKYDLNSIRLVRDGG